MYFALDIPAPSTDHLLAKVRRVDFLGALTLVSAVLALLFGLDAGSKVGWTHRTPLLCLAVVTPVLTAIFLYVEVRVAAHPFAPGRIIFDRSMIACYMANFFSMAAQMGAIFFLPMYFQAVHGYSATRSGTLLVPGMLSGVCASIAGGWYIRRTGRFYWVTVVGFGLLFAAIPVLAAGVWQGSIVLQEVGYVVASIGAYSGMPSSLHSIFEYKKS